MQTKLHKRELIMLQSQLTKTFDDAGDAKVVMIGTRNKKRKVYRIIYAIKSIIITDVIYQNKNNINC